MAYTVDIDDDVVPILKRWMKSNPNLYDKLRDILQQLAVNPRVGIGHPEPLRKGGGNIYSRRLSAHDRIIYKINDNAVSVLVVQIGGHYADK